MKRSIYHLLRFSLVTPFLIVPFLSVYAQDATPTPTADSVTDESAPIPLVHTVEEGENLTYLAETFGTTVEELLAVNNLSEDALLFVGQQLIIPGGEGDAVATLYTAEVGDTLAAVAATFNTTVTEILNSNHLINNEYPLMPGQTLSVVSRTGSALPQTVTGTPYLVQPGESLMMIAARHNLAPARLAALNELPFPTYLFPGQRLRLPSEDSYRFLPGEWVDVQIHPATIIPGATVSIYVENLLDGRPSGQFAGQSLQFTPFADGFVALVGLDAFAEAGLYALALSGSGNQPWRPMTQVVPVQAADYGTRFVTVGDELSGLLDPEVRANEDAFLAPIFGRFTEPQQWQGLFQAPITTTIISDGYGSGRSYNDGPVEIYHTGVDYAAAAGASIMAPANGTVVFSDMLELRGLVTIIDHGLGVMTAYFHQTESLVQVGDVVTTGQEIGKVGSTGLSSGPHLHWDVRIMNVTVDGRQWLNEQFP
jgi:murein DD-endopeptidase MepM/ murein hydrolase activator NlpD